jgi:hypothetical protein
MLNAKFSQCDEQGEILDGKLRLTTLLAPPCCRGRNRGIPMSSGSERAGRSFDKFMSQAANNPAQHGLLDDFGCFFDGKPLDLTLRFFWPLPALPRHFQREDVNFTGHHNPFLRRF